MSAVPERDAVDRCIKSARDGVSGLPAPQNEVDYLITGLAAILVDCTEAIVRQIRDADDTTATVMVPAIEGGFNDLVLALPTVGEGIANGGDDRWKRR